MAEALLKMSARRGVTTCGTGIKPGKEVNEQAEGHACDRLRPESSWAQIHFGFSHMTFDYVAKMDVPDLGDMVTAKWIGTYLTPAQGGIAEYRKVRQMIADKIQEELLQLPTRQRETQVYNIQSASPRRT